MDEEEIARQEEESLEEIREDIRGEFETAYLTEASLFAYETSAKQKLSDLADYMQVLTDTTKDISFRQKAGDMIQNIFHSRTIKVEFSLQDTKPSKELEVGHLIKKGLENKISYPPFTIDSILIHEPLHRINDSTYSGILRFSQNVSGPSISEISIKSIRRTTEFFVLKENKVFGAETLRVWNVRLGEIK